MNLAARHQARSAARSLRSIRRLRPAGVALLAFAALWAFVTLYPLFWTTVASLKTNSEIFGRPFGLPTEYHFEHYGAALSKANMGAAVRNSLLISVGTTLLTIGLASVASFSLARYKFRWVSLAYILFVAGVIIPIHSTMIPLVRTISAFKGQNNYLVLALLYTAYNLPIAIFIITAYFKGIPRDLDEAATMDGCGAFRRLTQILMPIALPAISTAAILTFLATYNELIFAMLFITKKAMYTVPLALLTFVGYRSTEYGPTFASVIISILPMLVIYLFFQEKVQKGLTAGAVKG
jgi:raffinose/stachyose/melibiose transport system permease protein